MFQKLTGAGFSQSPPRFFRRTAHFFTGLAIACLSACGGGGGDSAPPSANPTAASVIPPTVSQVSTPTVVVATPTVVVAPNVTLLRAATNDASAPPLAFSARSGGALSAQKTATGSQVDVKTASGNYRSVFDTTGVLKETVNVTTGEKIKVELVGGRVQLLRYSAGNTLLGAIAVFIQNGVVKVADLTGLPSFDSQLTGNVAGTTPASFALVADDFTGLTNIRNADPAVLALADNLLPVSASLTALQASLQNSSSIGGDAGLTALAFGGVDVGQVSRYAMVGALVGSVVPGGGTVVGAFVGSAMGILGQVVSSNRARLDALSTCMENIDTCKASTLDIGNSAGMALFGGLAANQSETDLLSNVISRNRTSWDNLKDNVRRAFDRTKDSVTAAVSATNFSSAPALPILTSQVTGLLVDRSNRTANLVGTVDPQGRINVTGTTSSGATSATVALTLTANGALPGLGQTASSSTTVQGTLTGALGSGTATGKPEAVGTCNRVQQSGGQGTFSYAHRLGNGVGVSNFFSDAYSIPDAFTVSYGAGLQYSTGGLVSGSRTVPLVLNGNPTVFVSVSAPTSGTGWEYSLSCPS